MGFSLMRECIIFVSSQKSKNRLYLRYFIELSYNGRDYHGWQNQPNAISVQQLVEEALSTLLKRKVAVVGAGRTDAGVHASQLFAHFDEENIIETKEFVYKLNAILPKTIVINDVFEVKPEIHARFDAISRSYLYRIALKKDVFSFNYSHYIKPKLDIEAMKIATKILFEYNDFECFSKVKTNVNTFNCTIIDAKWEVVGNELQFRITADRFLRNMVRAIVGTLLNVGTGKLKPEELHRIIKSKNRGEAGTSVPGFALYLIKVGYPEDIKL